MRLRLGSGLVLMVQVGFRFGFRLCLDWFQVWVRTLFRSGAGLALASQAWFRLGSNRLDCCGLGGLDGPPRQIIVSLGTKNI